MTSFRPIAFGSAEYEQARRLRDDVLRRPLGLALTDDDLRGEERQLHFGLFESEAEPEPGGRLRLVACVIAAPLSAAEANVRQMAVSPKRQGTGLGRRLLSELERELRARGFTRLVLSARGPAVGFYEKLGYAAVGDVYVAHTIPHFRMTKAI